MYHAKRQQRTASSITLVISISCLLLLFGLKDVQGKRFVRLCYFPSWAKDRHSELVRFDVHHIEPALCTHIVYAFGKLDGISGRLVPLYPDEDSTPLQTGRYHKFNSLKKNYPHLKTLISVGGESARSDNFIAIANNDNSLQTFAETTVDFLRKRDFDGLDVDWEYPNATTKTMYTKLLKSLRRTFDSERTSKDRLLLTVALPAGRHHIDGGFDIRAINRYVDLASLMTYDYHGSWSVVTGFDSPLYSRTSDHTFNTELSTNWTVQYYLRQGLSVHKVLVGVTAAGARFTLRDRQLAGVGAPVVSTSPTPSALWGLYGRYAYPEICRILEEEGSRRVFDEEQGVPYVYLGDQWCGYEDVQSIKGKVDWMVQQGVAGVMFWALDMDDFTGGLCHQGRFPLLKALSYDGVAADTRQPRPGHPQIAVYSPARPIETGMGGQRTRTRASNAGNVRGEDQTMADDEPVAAQGSSGKHVRGELWTRDDCQRLAKQGSSASSRGCRSSHGRPTTTTTTIIAVLNSVATVTLIVRYCRH